MAPVQQAAAQTNSDPAFANLQYSFTMDSSQDGSTTPVAVGTVAATDSDAGDTLTYSLRPSDSSTTMYFTNNSDTASHNGLFQLNSSTGAATSIGAENYGHDTSSVRNFKRYRGMANLNGKYYVFERLRNSMDLLNPEDGTTTALSSSLFLDTNSAVVAGTGDTLYVMHQNQQQSATNLYKYNHANNSLSSANSSKTNLGLDVSVEPRAMGYHNNNMYFYDSDGCLRTVSISTAQASTVIGTCGDLGEHETRASSMAVQGSSMYLIGNIHRLFTLNPATNKVTTVSNSVTLADSNIYRPDAMATGYTQPSGFQVNASTGAITYTGSGLAMGEYTLYLRVRDSKDSSGNADTATDDSAIVTINVTNAPATFVNNATNAPAKYANSEYSFSLSAESDGSTTPVAMGTVSATDADGDTLSYRLRATDSNTLYLLHSNGGDTNALYRVDLSGGLTKIGNQTDFGVPALTWLRGLAWHNGVLYTLDQFGYLYELNDMLGSASKIGTGGAGFGVGETRPTGIASLNGNLYMIGSANKKLYILDPDTGLATAVDDDTVNFGHATHGRFGLAALNGKLYTTRLDYLELFDVTDGTTTRVGASDNFGVGSTSLTDLASDGTSLYMVDRLQDKLYSVNHTTGAATHISAVSLGNASSAYGLAGGFTAMADYSVGASTGAITYTGTPAPVGRYRLHLEVHDGKNSADATDTSTDDTAVADVTAANRDPAFAASKYSFTLTFGADGSTTPVSVGAVAATDPDNDTLTYSLAPYDDGYFYGLRNEHGTANDILYRVDSSNGKGSRVGNASHFGLSDSSIELVSLTWHHGQLYSLDQNSGGLYVMNFATGTATRAGSTDGFGVGETSPGGIASHNGKMYLIGNQTSKLYTLNPDTGMAAAVDDNTTNFGHSSAANRYALASHLGKLYTINDDILGVHLEEVNTTNGVTSRVGASTRFGLLIVDARSLFSDGSNLYMAEYGASLDFVTLNTTTGVGTSVSELAHNVPRHLHGIADGYRRPAGYTIGSSGSITYTGSYAPEGTWTLYPGFPTPRATSALPAVQSTPRPPQSSR